MRQKKDPGIVKPPPSPKLHNNHSIQNRLKPYVCIISEPINPFQVPQDLIERNFIERSVITLEFALKSVEYSLSPHGQLRAWFKFWCLLFLYSSIPILLITPILSFLLHEFTGISNDLLLTSHDLFYSILYLSGGTITLILLLLLIRKLIKALFLHLLH